MRDIGSAYQRLQSGSAKLHPGRIVTMVGGAEQRCSFVKLQVMLLFSMIGA